MMMIQRHSFFLFSDTTDMLHVAARSDSRCKHTGESSWSESSRSTILHNENDHVVDIALKLPIKFLYKNCCFFLSISYSVLLSSMRKCANIVRSGKYTCSCVVCNAARRHMNRLQTLWVSCMFINTIFRYNLIEECFNVYEYTWI